MSFKKNLEPEDILVSSFQVHKTFSFTDADSGSGIYSVPMISHSIDFPFSLLNSQAEKILVGRFREIFKQRIKEGNENPWLCKEDYGNALLVWGIK